MLEVYQTLDPDHLWKYMDYPALADVVGQCIYERAIPLLFTEGGSMQLLSVNI